MKTRNVLRSLIVLAIGSILICSSVVADELVSFCEEGACFIDEVSHGTLVIESVGGDISITFPVTQDGQAGSHTSIALESDQIYAIPADRPDLGVPGRFGGFALAIAGDDADPQGLGGLVKKAKSKVCSGAAKVATDELGKLVSKVCDQKPEDASTAGGPCGAMQMCENVNPPRP